MAVNVWFNKTFSSVYNALRLIRQDDSQGAYTLFASHSNPHALVALAADRFFPEPECTGKEYVDWCVKFCRKQRIGIFVPGKEALPISRAQARFDALGTRILSAAPPDLWEVLNNKARFYAELHCPDAPAPLFRPFSSPDSFEAAWQKLATLCADLCVKPAEGVYGKGFKRIREEQGAAYAIYAAGSLFQIDLPSLRCLLAQEDNFPTLLLMEYLSGREYSADCLADHGQVRCVVARRKPEQNGAGQLIEDRADIRQACADITRQFALNGFVNIQFRENSAGELRTLEVNPRLSGGVAMSCLAGPNLPFLGLCGFDCGYEGLHIPPVKSGLRVGEINLAVRLWP